ncbi:MAG: sterol desaturase family protein [Chitinophagales bacterium]
MITAIAIVFTTFFAMEGVAWLTHKYVMHGFLWHLHRDHHQKDATRFLEKNDYFFLIFALPGILGLLVGVQQQFSFWFWIGLGITLYGMAYFFVHDVFIHRRFSFLNNISWPYFKAIRKAHKAHHSNTQQHGGVCFGMLWVPRKFFQNQPTQ